MATMKQNPLRRLSALGQSIWLDYIRRDLLTNGALVRMIEEDAVRGMTSNPAIFERAISNSADYDVEIRTLHAAGADVWNIYDTLSRHDVQSAADAFRRVYDDSGGRDGYVSLEVDPRLAHDAQRTIDEARRLWNALDRPNVMIKVPATRAGLIAFRQLITDGININVTLLFGLPRYREVTRAYLDGIDARLDAGRSVARVQSVASFFVSRIDTLVDARLDECRALGGATAASAESIRGEVAVASARLAYQSYREIFGGGDFAARAARGAPTQRLLWASTSTKAPGVSDVRYAEALIGSETVNTLPPETLAAYRDHGEPELRLEQDIDGARAVLERLRALGIDIDAVTQQLEDEGVEKFIRPFEQLLEALRKRIRT
jgi:transaldolase